MHLLIDGLTINAGGAYLQLCSFANYARSQGHRVTLVCGQRAIYEGRIADGVLLKSPKLVQWVGRLGTARLPAIALWRNVALPKLISLPETAIFNPNGIVPRTVSRAGPSVTMSQNMLPFDEDACAGFNFAYRLKLRAIRRIQLRSFKRAAGVVFISNYAATRIQEIGGKFARTLTIPLGVPDNFVDAGDRNYRISGNARIVYVSDLLPYKHHREVIAGIAILNGWGEFPLEATFVGRDWGGRLGMLQRQADAAGLKGRIRFTGHIDRRQLSETLRGADVALFASSCENCPTALIEKMRARLPIACSKMGPMPEVLGKCGRYLDPRNPESIAQVLAELLSNESDRAQLGEQAYERSLQFDTGKHNCALMDFVEEVAQHGWSRKGPV